MLEQGQSFRPKVRASLAEDQYFPLSQYFAEIYLLRVLLAEHNKRRVVSFIPLHPRTADS